MLASHSMTMVDCSNHCVKLISDNYKITAMFETLKFLRTHATKRNITQNNCDLPSVALPADFEKTPFKNRLLCLGFCA